MRDRMMEGEAYNLAKDKDRTCHLREVFKLHGGWEKVSMEKKDYPVAGVKSRENILKVLGFSERSLRRWVAEGLFPAAKVPGYWCRKALLHWRDAVDAVDRLHKIG